MLTCIVIDEDQGKERSIVKYTSSPLNDRLDVVYNNVLPENRLTVEPINRSLISLGRLVL